MQAQNRLFIPCNQRIATAELYYPGLQTTGYKIKTKKEEVLINPTFLPF